MDEKLHCCLLRVAKSIVWDCLALTIIHSVLIPIGALFSLISAVQVLSGAAAFVLYSLAYKTSLNMGWGTGTPFWLMAILYTISIPLLM